MRPGNVRKRPGRRAGIPRPILKFVQAGPDRGRDRAHWMVRSVARSQGRRSRSANSRKNPLDGLSPATEASCWIAPFDAEGACQSTRSAAGEAPATPKGLVDLALVNQHLEPSYLAFPFFIHAFAPSQNSFRRRAERAYGRRATVAAPCRLEYQGALQRPQGRSLP